MRIAFLTPEFITELVDGGGLGNYLNRMTQALRAEGHEPEVFVLSRKRPETIDFRGVPVHRVAPAICHLAVRVAYRLSRQLGTGHLNDAIYLASGALGLAKALRRREREAPFDLVQSADYLAVGLFVGHRRGRLHLIRCSWAADLYAAANGVQRRWETWLELASIRRRADVAYAPSRLVADHYHRTYGFDLRVLRPPIFLEETAHASPPPGLPNRFLFTLWPAHIPQGDSLADRGLTIGLGTGARAYDCLRGAFLQSKGPGGVGLHLGPPARPRGLVGSASQTAIVYCAPSGRGRRVAVTGR